MTGFGYKATKRGGASHVRLRRIKRTIEPIAAAHNDRFVGNVSFAIPKRKKMAVSDLVAL